MGYRWIDVPSPKRYARTPGPRRAWTYRTVDILLELWREDDDYTRDAEVDLGADHADMAHLAFGSIPIIYRDPLVLEKAIEREAVEKEMSRQQFNDLKRERELRWAEADRERERIRSAWKKQRREAGKIARRAQQAAAELQKALYRQRRLVTIDPSPYLCTLCEQRGHRCSLNSGQFTTLCAEHCPKED